MDVDENVVVIDRNGDYVEQMKCIMLTRLILMIMNIKRKRRRKMCDFDECKDNDHKLVLIMKQFKLET